MCCSDECFHQIPFAHLFCENHVSGNCTRGNRVMKGFTVILFVLAKSSQKHDLELAITEFHWLKIVLVETVLVEI